MISAVDTVLFENRVRLRIFLGKRIAGDPVVFQKRLNLHRGILN
jgi:hypothetical protein